MHIEIGNVKVDRFQKRGFLVFDMIEEKAGLGDVKLPLSQKQYDSLWILAQQEMSWRQNRVPSIYVTFDSLHLSVWEAAILVNEDIWADKPYELIPMERDEVLREMDSLIRIVETAGNNRVRVEYDPDKGYALKQE
jgi:hypothetical protein